MQLKDFADARKLKQDLLDRLRTQLDGPKGQADPAALGARKRSALEAAQRALDAAQQARDLTVKRLDAEVHRRQGAVEQLRKDLDQFDEAAKTPGAADGETPPAKGRRKSG